MEIIGLVNGNNPDDKRCVRCVDFSNHGRSIYAGEEFDCTYCGKGYLDMSETQGEACEPCANVGYAAKAVNRVEDAHGNMTAMCADCIDRNVLPDTPHTHTDRIGTEWVVTREPNAVVLVTEMAEGVIATVTYSGPNSWRYGIKDAFGDGEGASSGAEDTPRRLGYLMECAATSGEEWAEAAQDDYSCISQDEWDDYGYAYGDYEEYDSDLWNEY